MKLLLLSNSRGADGAYLRWAQGWIADFLAHRSVSALFIPFAAVPASSAVLDAYAAKVSEALAASGCDVRSIHAAPDPVDALERAEAIVVGGGNTFCLLDHMRRNGLLELIAARVRAGVPYVAWSAGTNLACPGIWTTNDMPVCEPSSLSALGLVPYQINAHFTDARVPGHRGETRPERIAEFLALKPEWPVVGLREDALLRTEGGTTRLFGTSARIFRAGLEPFDLQHGGELVFSGVPPGPAAVS